MGVKCDRRANHFWSSPNRPKSRIIEAKIKTSKNQSKKKMQREICWVKEKCIEDYIEKILSTSRHSLSLHRDSLSDKI